MFRRRRRDDQPQPADDPSGEPLTEPLAEPLTELRPEPVATGEPARPQGPWDVEDAPDDQANRLDLGGLRVPVPATVELRVDVNPDGQVVAASFVLTTGKATNVLQVSAFAAPRSEGLWPAIRAEIAESLRGSGGRAEEVDGPFGPELKAAVPTEVPDQGPRLQPARFLGVDGPRWFLRGLLTGPAATDPGAAAPLEEAFRHIVVVRGGEAMPAREQLPLRLPPEVMASQRPGQPDAEPGSGQPGGGTSGGRRPGRRTTPPGPLQRGPEITETH